MNAWSAGGFARGHRSPAQELFSFTSMPDETESFGKEAGEAVQRDPANAPGNPG
jgi:hypothetical protein